MLGAESEMLVSNEAGKQTGIGGSCSVRRKREGTREEGGRGWGDCVHIVYWSVTRRKDETRTDA
jgi:hypothetical protein